MMTKRNIGQSIPMQNLSLPSQNPPPYNVQGEFYPAGVTLARNSLISFPDMSDPKKAITTHNGIDYQLIVVEIEKEAELGLVIGKVEGGSWIFIDEILPNGMVETHGTLKEGDYLLQAGVYTLINVEIPEALLLIEKAYDEGRKSISFVAARAETKKEGKGSKASKPAPEVQPPSALPAVEVPENRKSPSNREKGTSLTPKPSTKPSARSKPPAEYESDTTQF